MTNREEITKRLLLFVNAKNWGKSDFARAAGIHRQNADRYLTGKSDPSKIAIKLMTEGLSVEWLLNGEGEMMQGEAGVKRQDSGHLTGGREELTIEEVRERYEQKRKYFMPAIGPQMTPYPISEGEMLIIDPEADPKENDLVLESSPEGPTIKKWQPGTTPLGVVVLATKNRETIRKNAGRISQTK